MIIDPREKWRGLLAGGLCVLFALWMIVFAVMWIQ